MRSTQSSETETLITHCGFGRRHRKAEDEEGCDGKHTTRTTTARLFPACPRTDSRCDRQIYAGFRNRRMELIPRISPATYGDGCPTEFLRRECVAPPVKLVLLVQPSDLSIRYNRLRSASLWIASLAQRAAMPAMAMPCERMAKAGP